MASFSGLGVGLSFIFGCIFMGLVAELCYLLWVRKRSIPKRETELSYMFCWKAPFFVNKTQDLTTTKVVKNQEINDGVQDLELGTCQDLLLKGFGEDGVDSELMRLHNLCGPPRFLFTIKEETKEDLESDDGKSRTRSLSDLIFTVDTPFLTPLSSPPIKAHFLDSYNSQGFNFNPLFDESSTEAEMNRLRSSPPPKFKFLKDAEEKLMRRLFEEAEKRVIINGVNVQD